MSKDEEECPEEFDGCDTYDDEYEDDYVPTEEDMERAKDYIPDDDYDYLEEEVSEEEGE